MDDNQITELLRKYNNGTLPAEGKATLESWYISQSANNNHEISEDDLHRNLALIAQRLPLKYQASTKKSWASLSGWQARIAAAASIILCLSVGGYVLLHKQPVQHITQNKVPDVKPGSDKAVLTLSNGKQISLTDAGNGKLAQQGNTTINKTANGQVVYQQQKNRSNADAQTAYNILTTPRGGKYSLTLADGTIAVLDAASSIKFPAAFTKHDRKVEITGQVYFEVVHNAAKPFKVAVKGQTIEDIGTHFNINAYDDEPVIRTTLLEGGISIAKGTNKVVLIPGQQATSGAGDNISLKNVDTEEAIAWKNGYFLFNDESLQSVMRKVSRWYDVDIEYPQGENITDSYGGSITRYGNVSKVLKMLEVTGNVRFRVEGKKIIVLKK